MKHSFTIIVAALAIGSMAAPAWANDALIKSGDLATTQPRGAHAGANDVIAYDIDLNSVRLAPVVAQG